MTSISKKKIALIEKKNQENLRNKAMKMGVTLKSPDTVFLSSDTKFGKNVIINQYVVIGKKTKIGIMLKFYHLHILKMQFWNQMLKCGPFSRIRPGISFGRRFKNW